MNPSDGMLPPTDAATEKQLTETLQELNRKLRNYFEIEVNQNTNAVSKLIKKISTLDATNANLEKTLKEIPEVTKQVSSAILELNKLKEQELIFQQKKDYEKKQSDARAEAGQEFDRKKARQKEVLETFNQGPGGTEGLEAIIGKSVQAIFSKKARQKLSEELEEYGTALKNKQTSTPEKEAEERQKYIEDALAKKGLKNEYSLETIVGTSIGDELTKLTKKKSEEEEKKQPPIQVVLEDINKPALNKLLNLFSTAGGESSSNTTIIPVSKLTGAGRANKGNTPPRNVTPPSTLPKAPTVPALPAPGSAKTSSAPSTKALPPGPVKPLLGPGDNVIDIGGPSNRPNLNPNRPGPKNVTPSKTSSISNASGKMLTSGRMLGGGIVPYISGFLFNDEIEKAMDDFQLFGKSIRERIDDLDLKLFGPVNGQTELPFNKVNPGGSLMESAELEEEIISPSVVPSGETLSNFDLPQYETSDERENLQELTSTLKLYTESVNNLIKNSTDSTIPGKPGNSTTLGTINNSSAVNNIIYNADNRINVNRDMFKETIKFNYKLLK